MVEGLGDVLEEHGPVAETGEGVVQRLVAEIVLEGLPEGDVACVQHHAGNRALVAEVGDGDVEVPLCPVPVLNPDLQARRFEGARSPGRSVELLGAAEHEVPLVEVEQVEDGGVDQLVGQVPQCLLHGRAHVGDGAERVDHHHDVAGSLDQRPEAGLSSEDLLLGRLAVGDLPGVDDHPPDLGIAAQVAGPRLEPAVVAVGVDDADLDGSDVVVIPRSRPGQHLGGLGPVVGVDQIDGRRPHDVARIHAEDMAARRAGEGQPAFVVGDHHDVGGVLDQHLEPSLALLAVQVLGQRRALQGQRHGGCQLLDGAATGVGQARTGGDDDGATELGLGDQWRDEHVVGGRPVAVGVR